METATILIVYISGFLTGSLVALIAVGYIGKLMLSRKEKSSLDKKSLESVSVRMKKVKELTSEQLELYSAASGPQKNALHGRYKNGLNGRIKEIEEEKTAILKSIITDGFDPEISVMDDAGVITKIKLSEYLAQSGIVIPPKEEAKETPKAKQLGKFTVVKGGRDDSGNTTH